MVSSLVQTSSVTSQVKTFYEQPPTSMSRMSVWNLDSMCQRWIFLGTFSALFIVTMSSVGPSFLTVSSAVLDLGDDASGNGTKEHHLQSTCAVPLSILVHPFIYPFNHLHTFLDPILWDWDLLSPQATKLKLYLQIVYQLPRKSDYQANNYTKGWFTMREENVRWAPTITGYTALGNLNFSGRPCQ